MQRKSLFLSAMEAKVSETEVMENSGDGVDNKQRPPNQLPLYAWMQIEANMGQKAAVSFDILLVTSGEDQGLMGV